MISLKNVGEMLSGPVSYDGKYSLIGRVGKTVNTSVLFGTTNIKNHFMVGTKSL